MPCAGVFVVNSGQPVSVVMIRVLGTELAELALVATELKSRRQGHARAFITTLQEILKELGVKVMCLSAKSDAHVSLCSKDSSFYG